MLRVPVTICINSDGLDAGVFGCSNDSDGYLTTVGNQQLGDLAVGHNPIAYWQIRPWIYNQPTKNLNIRVGYLQKSW